MKITRLETFLVRPRSLFLKIHTDAGLVGLGEPVLEGRARTCAQAVAELEPYLIGQDPRFVLAASGHVAGVINPPAKNKRSYWTHADLSGEPVEWLKKAQEKAGSWWPDWDGWMKRHSSGTVPAPSQPGNANYPVIEAAPGRYVKQKSN